MELRNKIFHSDCVKELYGDDSLLPEDIRTERPKAGDVRAMINERIAAIVVHEYRRLYRLAGQDFINGDIDYDEYVERTKGYSVDASKLCPSQYR